MKKIRVGLLGFGKTGRMVAQEFLQAEGFSLQWVIRKTGKDNHKFVSRLLGLEKEEGKLFSLREVGANFASEHAVDVVADFSAVSGMQIYDKIVKQGTGIVSAISDYSKKDLEKLEILAGTYPILYSPNITLGINVMIVVARIMQSILPQADIEIVEEHFRDKHGVSGTAKKIAGLLELSETKHVNSIRVGGIVGKHEIIFGLPNQIMRLTHESTSRGAFGQGAIFAAQAIVSKLPGLYTMENIVAEMFGKNIPVY